MSRFVGSRSLLVNDPVKNISFQLLLFYPTQKGSSPIKFGSYLLDSSPDAPIDVENSPLPLLLLSHGAGGSPLVYRHLILSLAKDGYVVAVPEHYGDNRNNNALSSTMENLENRPHHLRLTIDALAADLEWRNYVNTTSVAVLGHSMGGYTALAVAGGQPWTGMKQKVEVTPDKRVKSLVLMAPATSWFVPNDSLENVEVPILLLTAEKDSITPRWQSQLILDLVPDRTKITFKLIENGGHFSFLTPFPPATQKAGFPPAVDPEGFDREKFQEELTQEIKIFLKKTL
ncbi:MAG: alpha/beta fold hydrolase [Oligoflexia bacterium]|nr:alpha/beta fold hydrolase [Oligoflexia bacterium]MBF0366984.1 alpha/beta fold hydrolase [Oligoflexia bacterium]